MSFNVDDRVKVVSYGDKGWTFPPERLALVIGQVGTVVESDDEDGFVDVLMDNEVIGIHRWVFRAGELEVI